MSPHTQVATSRLGHVFLAAVLIALIGGLNDSVALAAIVGINTPVTSSASITFDDTNSSMPPSGITNSGPSVSPWNGSILSMPLTTDINTGDSAAGNLDASFIFASNIYAINLTGVSLSQFGTNTGYADLYFRFTVEFQLDAAGLPAQPTLFPNFAVTGTVQNIPGSFAAVGGFIDYYGVNTAGVLNVIETVNYNSVWNTPGPFTGTAVGVPVNGTTPLLGPNSVLVLDGLIHFRVDPATINASSVQVPEPSTLVLAVLGLAPLGIAVRRRRR